MTPTDDLATLRKTPRPAGLTAAGPYPTRYCQCGRQMVRERHTRPYHDSRTGRKEADNVLVCPRYRRAWHNMWLGGWGHEGLLLDDDGYLTFVGLGWR